MPEIGENSLSDIVENDSLDDEVLFLKPEFEITDFPEDSTPLGQDESTMELDASRNERFCQEGCKKGEFVPSDGPSDHSHTDASLNGEGGEIDQEQTALDEEHICWSGISQFEPCCIAVHPKFPEVAHVAIGNCGDCCVIYDFDSNNQGTENGELATLGPLEETVSCCSFSSCGRYLALGCLDGNLLVYSSQASAEPGQAGDQYVLLKRIEKMLPSIEWLDLSEDSELLAASGQDGILVVYQLRQDEIQILNTNHHSNTGRVIAYTNEQGEKEYNVLSGCNDNNLVIATLNAYLKQVGLSKISESSYSSKLFSDEEQGPGGDIISLCVHNKLKLCAFGTVTGNVSFVNLNKKAVIRCYNNLHKNSVESLTFSNHRSARLDNSVGSSELVVSVGLDGLVVVYDVLNNCAKINAISVGYGLTKVLVHPHRSQFVAASVAGSILVLSAQRVLREVRCHTQPILDLQLLSVTGDCYAITVSEDRRIAICNDLFDQ